MAYSVQGRQRKVRQVKGKVKGMLSIFFNIKGILKLVVCILLRVLNKIFKPVLR
jgi:hypothetical protein